MLLFFLLVLPKTSFGCSFECSKGFEPCLDNAYGYLDSLCSQLLGCTNQTQPCAGECHHKFPILSEDGKSCRACDGQVCPECKDGEYWCRKEQLCKPHTAPCEGVCSSRLRPVLDPIAKECYPCGEGKKWCENDQVCFDPDTSPCGGECLRWGMIYCPQKDACIYDDVPCEDSKVSGSEDLVLEPQMELCSKKTDMIVHTSDGTIYVFVGDHFYFSGEKEPHNISDSWPGLPGNIDAALTWNDTDSTYFFKGDKYWKFQGQTPTPDYPKNIKNWKGLPSNIDAAIEWGNQESFQYFFKGQIYLKLKSKDGVVVAEPKEPMVAGKWWFGCPEKMTWNIWIPMARPDDNSVTQ